MAKLRGNIEMLNSRVIDLVEKCAQESNNPNPYCTSTWRSPYNQARVMAENLYNGKNINYKWAGQQVINVWEEYCFLESKSQVITRMEAKIIELSENGVRVSNHCVSKEQYDLVNIFDIAPSTLPNPRDLVKHLEQCEECIRIITPYKSDYQTNKVIVDIKEPAIHCEISTISKEV